MLEGCDGKSCVASSNTGDLSTCVRTGPLGEAGALLRSTRLSYNQLWFLLSGCGRNNPGRGYVIRQTAAECRLPSCIVVFTYPSLSALALILEGAKDLHRGSSRGKGNGTRDLNETKSQNSLRKTIFPVRVLRALDIWYSELEKQNLQVAVHKYV